MWLEITENNIFKDHPFLKDHNVFNSLDSQQLKFCILYCARLTGPARKFSSNEKQFKLYCAIFAGYYTQRGDEIIPNQEALQLSRTEKLPKVLRGAVDIIKKVSPDYSEEERISKKISGLEKLSENIIAAMNNSEFSTEEKSTEITVAQKIAFDSVNKKSLSIIEDEIDALRNRFKKHEYNNDKFLANIKDDIEDDPVTMGFSDKDVE